MYKTLTIPFASLALARYPLDSHPSLQAFDAADEYLLTTVAQCALPANSQFLIINDAFGALACNIATSYSLVDSYGDSYLAELALKENLAHNHLATTSVQFIPSTEPLKKTYDIVLIKIPKTLALLEEQLIKIKPHITKNTVIYAAAMIKHLPKAAILLLEKHIGSAEYSLAVKKARLLTVTPHEIPLVQSPYPTYYSYQPLGLKLTNHANVFCREGLDIGTRVLIPYLKHNPHIQKVADLGCGNGIMGIIWAMNNPEAELVLIDESYMAIASAKENWQRIFSGRAVVINVSDGLIEQQNESLDCVLCNPPFHQQQVIGDYIARRMFKQAHNSLKPTGELWVVANRHLNYFQLLKKCFKEVKTINQTNKFIIVKAIK